MENKHNFYKEIWEKKLKDLKGVDKHSKKELKALINRFYLLDSIVYVYCMERRNSTGNKFLDPVVVNYETPALMACYDLIELQRAYKKEINEFSQMGIETTIVPMVFPAFWELNKSIIPAKEAKNKYGFSFIAHKDAYSTENGNPMFLHGLHSFNLDNICVKNLNSDLQIVERQKYVPIILEATNIE